MSGGQETSGRSELLLVEDSLSDIRLAREALRHDEDRLHLSVVRDGEEALAFLARQPPYVDALRPALILLDLNLPRKDGREVLATIKNHDDWKTIPVCVLTTSTDNKDLLQAYQLHANCYLEKSMNVNHFMIKLRRTVDFWINIVAQPRQE
ncbi:MAG: response regulator [Pirellulales bacterium]